MSKFIEILAMVLGGLSLFSVAFVGFASMAGKPLNELPGLGGMFSPDEEASTEEPAPEMDPSGEPQPRQPRERRTNQAVIETGIGVMGAWSLPSPFTQVELKGLADELKARKLQLDERAMDLDEREIEAGEKLRTVNERFEVLDRMRSDLEKFEQELELREQEVLRDEDAADQEEQRRWSDKAAVLEGLDPTNAATRLLDYDADDAAQILRSMEPDTATKILNALTADRWKEYVEAYTSAAPRRDRV